MQTKDMDYWNHVLWSDETKINLFGSDGVKRLWRKSGEEYKDKCLAYIQAWWWECHGLGLHECCQPGACLVFWGPQQVFPEGPPSVDFAIDSGIGMGIVYLLSILI